MFTENPFEALARQLNKLEANQAETLQLLRSIAIANTSAAADETPISTEQAAQMFGIAKQTLYQNSRKIKHTKRFGRLYWYPCDLREYLKKGDVAA